MALNPDTTGVSDPSIPQWKRELIIRRRALGRTLQVGSSSVKLTCPAVVAVVRQPELASGSENIYTNTQKCSPLFEDSSSSSLNQNRVDFHPGTSSAGSVSTMRLLDACSEVDNLVINNGIDVKNKQSVVTNKSDTSVNYSLIMGEDKSLNLKKKSASRPKQEKSNCNATTRQRFFIENLANEGTNGKASKDEDYLSDSSEELQYGPGIVNKLKTKYLSMTLREQKRNIRPSLSNLRRATSLENMLEGDDNLKDRTKIISESKLKNESVNLNEKNVSIKKSIGFGANRGTRPFGNRLDTMKRAQSMDTLLKSEVRPTIKPIVNENIVIVEKENLELNPSADPILCLRRDVNTELPPPDLVKQTLKIFETSPKRKAKPTGQGNLAKLVAGFSNPTSQPVSSLSSRSMDRRKVVQNNKPTLSPKPVLSPEKLKRTKVGSPKRTQHLISSVQTTNRILPSSIPITPSGFKNDKEKHQIVQSEQVFSEKQTVTSPKAISPTSVSPVVSVLNNSDHPSLILKASEKNHSHNSITNGKDAILVKSNELEEVDDSGEFSKPVPEAALENIRRGGISMQFSFSDEGSQSLSNKSYLPRSKNPPQALNTSLLKEKLEKSPPTSSFVPPRQLGSPQTKQVGVIRPLVSTKIQSSVSSTPPLTEQEIEKNLINRVKSIEQPISKVVVAIKAIPDNVVLGSVSSDLVTNKSLSLTQSCATSKVKNQGLWDEKIWHANQNTIVFNFSNRKEVPDYIENDGLILRGKRDRPRPGDGGFILLDGGSSAEDADESSTEAEDLVTSAPPSPCDVTFVGDNVLINGKSNLKKSAKQVKLRIQFNDEATTMFEYPSEASLVEEEAVEAGSSGQGHDEGDIAQGASPLAPGLSMNLGIPPPDFLPPPVPSRPPPPPPLDRCPSLPLSAKRRAPQPPRLLYPVRPSVPPRSPPRLLKSHSLDVVSSLPREPISHPQITAECSKKKYFSMKKVRKPSKPIIPSEQNFETKDESILPVKSRNEISIDTSLNHGEVSNTDEVEVTDQNLFSELSLADDQSQNKLSNTSYTSESEADFNILNTFDFSKEFSNSNSGNFPSTQKPINETTINESYVVKLDNLNISKYKVSLSDTSNQNYGTSSLTDNKIHQTNSYIPESMFPPASTQKKTSDFSDKSANEVTFASKLPFEKSNVKEISYKIDKTNTLTSKSVIDLLKSPKPVKIVQPFMGTKSLPSSLLGNSNLDTPTYCPVYSKPSLVCSNSELSIDPVLSQVLNQRKITSPTFVNRSLSTNEILVLEDWPLGGSLGAYTPRQVAAGDWQLGVTPVLPPPAPPTASTTDKEDDHLKPAPPEATVAWSEDTASDLLF